MIIKLFFFMLFGFAYADWLSLLSSGSLSGYLTTSEVSSFVSSLNTANITVLSLGTTVNNNKIPGYLLSQPGIF